MCLKIYTEASLSRHAYIWKKGKGCTELFWKYVHIKNSTKNPFECYGDSTNRWGLAWKRKVISHNGKVDISHLIK